MSQFALQLQLVDVVKVNDKIWCTDGENMVPLFWKSLDDEIGIFWAVHTKASKVMQNFDIEEELAVESMFIASCFIPVHCSTTETLLMWAKMKKNSPLKRLAKDADVKTEGITDLDLFLDVFHIFLDVAANMEVDDEPEDKHGEAAPAGKLNTKWNKGIQLKCVATGTLQCWNRIF